MVQPAGKFAKALGRQNKMRHIAICVVIYRNLIHQQIGAGRQTDFKWRIAVFYIEKTLALYISGGKYPSAVKNLNRRNALIGQRQNLLKRYRVLGKFFVVSFMFDKCCNISTRVLAF